MNPSNDPYYQIIGACLDLDEDGWETLHLNDYSAWECRLRLEIVYQKHVGNSSRVETLKSYYNKLCDLIADWEILGIKYENE